MTQLTTVAARRAAAAAALSTTATAPRAASAENTSRSRHPPLALLPVLLPLLLLLSFPSDSEAGNAFRIAVAAAAAPPCRVVSTADPFNLTAYAVHPWYVQQQQIISYQPLDTLYCVRASYTPEFDGAGG